MAERTAPTEGEITTLAELFPVWLATKKRLKPQSRDDYSDIWERYGRRQIGELLITEFTTARAERHLVKVTTITPSSARTLRVVLTGMLSLAVRHGVIAVNPMRETERPHAERKPIRALTPAEFSAVQAAVVAYQKGRTSGPEPGRLLLPFITLLLATGARPNELLGAVWDDVDLTSDPPTITLTGTAVDHGQVRGQKLHRQDKRKGDAPDHTLILPQFAVEALSSLPRGRGTPVFANRDGGWMSLANLRRSLRAALADEPELSWITFQHFRRTVATVVRDASGLAAAQAQLSHARASTTEGHYAERITHGPDVRAALDTFVEG